MIYNISGFLIILACWSLISFFGIFSELILPSPLSVFLSLPKMFESDNLLQNIIYSLYLNFAGYGQAVGLALPLGFLLGLFPTVRKIFSKYIDAIRYIPLTATLGLFIAWFGIEDTMKIQFLSFGIFVYLLPTVVQRIDEVDKVHLDTTYTLGASRWQQVYTVYLPSVLSRVSDDIRVLVAISWTYLVVAEVINRTGGLGALAYLSARQSKIDQVYGVLLVIMLIGLLQDKLLYFIDKLLFPYKKIGNL
ncbi:MAG: ABC transporter permease subunit [Leptospira sp.]|nr:ABC transporter permease subunit [Leptospira sp.]